MMGRSAEAWYAPDDRDLESAAWHQHETELRRARESAGLRVVNVAAFSITKGPNTVNANTLDALSFDQLVPTNSKFLGKNDVTEDGLVLTIRGFKYESIKTDEGTEDKVVLHFVEDVKPFVLNRTNAQLLAVCTGARTAGEAKGKKIVVYLDPTVAYGGRVTGGLRIKKAPSAPRAPAAAAPAPASEDFNDDVPF